MVTGDREAGGIAALLGETLPAGPVTGCGADSAGTDLFDTTGADSGNGSAFTAGTAASGNGCCCGALSSFFFLRSFRSFLAGRSFLTLLSSPIDIS